MSENKDLVSQQKSLCMKSLFSTEFSLFAEYYMASKSLGLRVVFGEGQISGNCQKVFHDFHLDLCFDNLVFLAFGTRSVFGTSIKVSGCSCS